VRLGATVRAAAGVFRVGLGLSPAPIYYEGKLMKGIRILSALALVASHSMAAPAAGAQSATPAGGCVVLQTVAEVETEALDEKGKPVKRLVPATRVVPGGEVVWTVTASNVCDKAADRVLIDNPIPEHMTYSAASALGAGTEVTFSLDGMRYASPAELTVREADGTIRAARPDEYRHIRWRLRNRLAPGAILVARYRATVK
jgi:uncharacterized repeat protein (TIGR01451 family)